MDTAFIAVVGELYDGIIRFRRSGRNIGRFTIAFDESDRTTYGSMSETVTSDDDFIENSQFASVVTITYNGTTATVGNGVSGVEVSSNGAHIVVNSTVSGVEYVLNGTTTNGSFKVYSEKK